MRLIAWRSCGIILLYHRIARTEWDPWSLCVTPEHFAEHLEVLKKYRCVPLSQIQTGSWRLSSRGLPVAITFDDGYADNLHEARRLLELYDTPATFFLTTGYLGAAREFWWDELERLLRVDPCEPQLYFSQYQKLQPVPHRARQVILDRMLESGGGKAEIRPSHRPLNVDEVLRLAAGGLFEIGAHTVTHPVLAALPLRDQYAELLESKTWLEGLLARRVTSVSFPFGGCGHYTPDTVQAVQALGYVTACTTSGHAVMQSDSPFKLPRRHVPDMNVDEFEQFLRTA
jgi:peptidoglycan/xylan/chitin deacetylase (PgdA/CDA1 family)